MADSTVFSDPLKEEALLRLSIRSIGTHPPAGVCAWNVSFAEANARLRGINGRWAKSQGTVIAACGDLGTRLEQAVLRDSRLDQQECASHHSAFFRCRDNELILDSGPASCSPTMFSSSGGSGKKPPAQVSVPVFMTPRYRDIVTRSTQVD